MTVKKTSARSQKTTATAKRRGRAKSAQTVASTAGSEVDAVSYRFNAVLAINNLGVLHNDLAQLAANNTDVQLDASAVEMIDTASIQLILAFVIELKSRNRSLTWLAPADTLIASAALLGLTQTLGIA